MTSKILIVDDEKDLEILVSTKFRKQIKDKTLNFVFAHNGLEALEKFKLDPEIDVIFTDINMPEMDGLTLLQHLNQYQKQSEKLFKAVVVSAYGDMGNIRTAMNLGASDFITKPIDFKDFEITITKTIDQIRVVKEYLEDRKKMKDINVDLTIAKIIQQSFLPSPMNEDPLKAGFEIKALMIPAKEIGGDFYDYFRLSDNKLGLVIADVSGKGIPAALFMSVSRTLIHSMARADLSPQETLFHVNAALCKMNELCMFVTTFYAIFDIETGILTYCNEGHNPPYLLSENGELTKLEDDVVGVALGIVEPLGGENYQITLKENDTLILYTDGITEATNAEDQLYENWRLETFLKDHAKEPVYDLLQGILTDVSKFVNGFTQSDDITLLLLRKTI